MHNNMKILVVGLGLMGGAYCYNLSKLDKYEVYGVDVSYRAIDYAIEHKYIIDGDTSPEVFIPNMDVIILAIYPQAILHFLENYRDLFYEGQIITDISGVKSSFLNKAKKLALPADYCSSHPMAGREKVGIEYSEKVIFKEANYLVVPLDDTKEESIKVISQIGIDLGFKNVTTMNMDSHDNMIAYTSQLAHAIAVALVNSDTNENTEKYIGDSYRDLTRIAMINENLWSELFLENKDFLIKHIEEFENQLNLVKDAISNNDKDSLKKYFIESTRIRKGMEKDGTKN